MSILVRVALLTLLAAFLATWADAQSNPNPVLVELFTSEGCSDCPPADRVLQDLDKQPVAGAQIIVLSEHVDYWNQIGWADPYSSRFFSDRQNSYSNHFGLNTVYTPQMIVDGTTEFVGSDSRHATRACQTATTEKKIPVRISSISVQGSNMLRAHLEAEALPESYGRTADVYAALALNRADSEVSSGENSGRHLTHVAVVQNLTKVGTLDKGKGFSQDVSLKIAPGTNPANLRLIAFVQESGPGKVLGAASERVGK